MLRIYLIYVVVALMMTTSAMRAEDNQYNITVTNDTNQDFVITHPIPAHTIAAITVELTKIDPQEMLHKAIMANSKEDVIKAIKAGANVNCAKDGKAPILLAVILKRDKAVEGLLECNANVYVMYNGLSLVDHAVKMNYSACEIVVSLIESGASYTEDEVIKYAFACFNHTTSKGSATQRVIAAMLKRGLDLNANFASKFLSSGLLTNASNRLALVQYLLDKGLNPNYIIEYKLRNGVIHSRTTMLFLAIVNNNTCAVELLLNAGADINKKLVQVVSDKTVHTPISYAISLGRSQIVELLLQHGAAL